MSQVLPLWHQDPDDVRLEGPLEVGGESGHADEPLAGGPPALLGRWS